MVNARVKVLMIATAVIVVGLIFWMQSHQISQLRQENDALRREVTELQAMAKSTKPAPAPVAPSEASLSEHQLQDLMRLRNEARVLREATNDLAMFKQQNEKLRVAVQNLAATHNQQTTDLTQTNAPLAVYPKNLWANVGYATPEDAFQSLNWAAANGDIGLLRSNLTLDAQQDFDKQFENKSEAEVVANIESLFAKKTEARILNKNMISDDFAVLEVSDGTMDSNKLIFRKVDGQWRLTSDH